jgi:CheY-like chemotaxis protein
MLYAVQAMPTDSRPLVLVVDDEPVIADTIAQILEKRGYAAIAAYDGEDAIQAALLNPPQLVISDVMMPGMNGIELGISIRRIFPDCKSDPVIGSIRVARSNRYCAVGGESLCVLGKAGAPRCAVETCGGNPQARLMHSVEAKRSRSWELAPLRPWRNASGCRAE